MLQVLQGKLVGGCLSRPRQVTPTGKTVNLQLGPDEGVKRTVKSGRTCAWASDAAEHKGLRLSHGTLGNP